MYIFYGEPRMLVRERKRTPVSGEMKFKPLFRFDDNGEYRTENNVLIEKLKSRFDHKEILDGVAIPNDEENTVQSEYEVYSTIFSDDDIRNMAKDKKIKSWHVKSIDSLRKELGV